MTFSNLLYSWLLYPPIRTRNYLYWFLKPFSSFLLSTIEYTKCRRLPSRESTIVPKPDVANSINFHPRGIFFFDISVSGMVFKKCMISDGERKRDYYVSQFVHDIWICLFECTPLRWWGEKLDNSTNPNSWSAIEKWRVECCTCDWALFSPPRKTPQVRSSFYVNVLSLSWKMYVEMSHAGVTCRFLRCCQWNSEGRFYVKTVFQYIHDED